MIADRYRKCAERGCETCFIPKSIRNRFCLRHRKTGPVDPEHYRKYGTRHRRLRKQWASRVARGNVACSRCGELIDPRDRWDLDHVEGGGPLDYHGPSHARCNPGDQPARGRPAVGSANEDLVSHGKHRKRRPGVHKVASSPETLAWNRDHLIPKQPPWMDGETHRKLAELRRELKEAA